MQPEIMIAAPRRGRALPAAAALGTLWFSAALGCVALRRWRRAAFWLVADGISVALTIWGALSEVPRVAWLGLGVNSLFRLSAAVDAFLLARKARGLARWPLVIRVVLVIGAVVLARSVVRQGVVEAFRVRSAAMSPTLWIGDRVVIDKRARSPRRGDVVAVDTTSSFTTDDLRRVVAVGGDTVEIVKGQLFLNGKAVWRERVQNGCPEGADVRADVPCVIWEETLDERRYQVGMAQPVGQQRDLPRRVVPPGAVFVLGDNRDSSADSRTWGAVPLDRVWGTARFVGWSFDRNDGPRWDRVNIPVR